MLDLLNTREWALLIWSLIALAVVLRNPGVRKAANGVVRALLNPRLVAVFCLSAIYIAVGLWVWSLLGLFNVDQIKPAVLWGLIGAPVALFRVGTADAQSGLVRRWISDTLRITVVVEFIAHFQTFPLIVELLLIPLSTLVVMMVAYAGTNPEYAQLRRMLNACLALIGAALVGYGLWSVLRDFSGFASGSTLRDLYTTPLLASWMTPFLYIVFLYARYGVAHSAARVHIQDRRLRDFAFSYAIIAFHIRTYLLKRWTQKIAEMSPTSREEVKTSIKHVLGAHRVNRNRAPVEPEAGWDPVEAGRFLAGLGLQTNDYHESYGDWFSESSMVAVTEAWPNNYLKYSVNGDAEAANRLHLKLYLNNRAEEATALDQFSAAFARLLDLALTPEDRALAPETLDPTQSYSIMLNVSRLDVSRDDHADRQQDGCDISIELKRGTDCPTRRS
tara:strand:- start:1512 stop:2849 length:1338 start_codon:yes stop_codon:yes gene_type:complete